MASKETVMSHRSKGAGAIILRLIVGLALLGWPRVASAQGTWSVISLPPKPGEVLRPAGLAVDGAGNLYVADSPGGYSRVQKRDAQGNWSVIANYGLDTGQVYAHAALAVDAAGNFYVADRPPSGVDRIQKRDAQGNWSVLLAIAG